MRWIQRIEFGVVGTLALSCKSSTGRTRGSTKVLAVLTLLAVVLIQASMSDVAHAENPSNGKLAVSVGRLDSGEDIWIMDSDGTNPVNLTASSTQANGAPSLDRYPAWSPDGTMIAFSSNRGTNKGYRIWVMDADGSNPRRVTSSGPTGNEWDRSPAWSPDGGSIVFTRNTSEGGTSEPRIYVIETDGTGLSEVVGFGGGVQVYRSSPRWAPDGSLIAFARSDEATSDGPIASVRPDSAQKTFLNPNTGWSRWPDWSPDSNKIAYERCAAPCNPYATDIRVMSRDGTGDVLFASDGEAPVWSPDGSLILYSRNIGTSGNPVYRLFRKLVSGGATSEIPIPLQDKVFSVFPEWDWQPVPPPPGDPIVGLVDPTQGEWHLYDDAGTEAKSFYFGNPGDLPIMGDWDCDGVETPGMYRQSDGYVYLRNSNTQGIADVKFFFGNPGDVPIAGDFNGDGCGTVSIYRPSNQTFYIINALGKNDGGLGAAQFSYVFGNPGDKPFVGDFDGDGVETVGLHRESTGLVYFRNSHTQGIADAQFIYGDPGDRIVAGDWNSDGKFSPALYRPSNTTMYFRHTNTQGNADNQFVPNPNGSAWIPVAGALN